MTVATLTQQMEKLFQQQIETANALLKALGDENQALIQRNYERSKQAAQQKENLMAEMKTLGTQQQRLMAQAKLPFSAQGFDELISNLPNAAANSLQQLRNKLEDAIEVCHEQNIVNGQIIAVNKQSAETALAILRGQFSTENVSYGAAGQPIVEHSAKPISKA